METLGNSVSSEDLTFPESSLESKFWSRSVGPSTVYNMKSEGSYTNNSSDGSCLPGWIQVMEQSGKYNQSFSSACDSTELERIDQAKCGFPGIASPQCNQYSKPMDNILEDSSLGLRIRTLESQFDRWQFPYAGWDHEAGQEEFKSPLSAPRKAIGEGLFHSEISDDSSLDGGVPAGSSLSSGSNSLVTVEDDVCVNATSTSVELHSLSNIALSSPRLLPRPNIALSSTCSEGSTQVRSCGLDSSFPEHGSRVLDQTLPSGADADHNSLAAKLQLGNEGTIVLVQPQSPDLKQQTDGQQTPSSMKVKRKHEVQALDGNESSWSTKRLKLSSPSPPTTPAGLPVPFPAVNFTGVNGMNANPPVAPPPFLVRNSTTPDVYQVPALSTLGSSANLTKPPYMGPPQFMYAASFTDVNDAKEIENSRPKRRNVKISTDPQSVAARLRREKISNRMRKLQTLVPGGMKMDTASMLDEAISFVKYLQQQLRHQYTLECLPKAGFYPRMQFSDVCPSDRFPDISRYYMPARPVQGDCSTVLQIAPGESPEHGMYGASAGQSAMKFPDVNREQFCH